MTMNGKCTLSAIETIAWRANDDTCRTRLNHMGGRWLRVVFEGNGVYSYWYDMPHSSTQLPRVLAEQYLRGEVEYRNAARRAARRV